MLEYLCAYPDQLMDINPRGNLEFESQIWHTTLLKHYHNIPKPHQGYIYESCLPIYPAAGRRLFPISAPF